MEIMQMRQQNLEKELSVMKDTIWRLQGRIYTLETFLKEKFGEIVVDFGLRLLNSASASNFMNSAEHVSVNEVFQSHAASDRNPLEELDLSNRNPHATVIQTSVLRHDTSEQWQQAVMSKTVVNKNDRLCQQDVYYQEEVESIGTLEPDILRDASTSDPTTVSINDEFVVIPQESKFCISDLSVGANVIAEVEPAPSTSTESDNKPQVAPTTTSRKKKKASTITEFKCIPCNRSFTFEWRYKAHLLQHSGQGKTPKPVNRPYICQYCNKKFINKNVLQVHTRIHTGEKPYKCLVCDKAFSQSSSCKTHMRIHTKEKPYQCRLCDASFAHSQNLHKHTQSVH